MNPTYLATARLKVDIEPAVFESGLFGLKGGTAINLFLREMPRLSVDLDLTFVDYRLPRVEALAAIDDALRVTRGKLVKRGLNVQTVPAAEMGETKLLVRSGNLVVKIEVNTVATLKCPLIRLSKSSARCLSVRKTSSVTCAAVIPSPSAIRTPDPQGLPKSVPFSSVAWPKMPNSKRRQRSAIARTSLSFMNGSSISEAWSTLLAFNLT